MDTSFSRNLIKGKIAETIFEQMIREEKRYTVIPFGYEHTMPTLAQYRDRFSEVGRIIDNIADAPDFALVSVNESPKIYLVEVKYQSELDMTRILGYATKLLERWECPWVFVATPNGFYCGMCQWITKEGKINPLSKDWVDPKIQEEYLKLLNEFER